MRTVTLKTPDLTEKLIITYVYISENGRFVGSKLITQGDDPEILMGRKPCVLKTEEKDDKR